MQPRDQLMATESDQLGLDKLIVLGKVIGFHGVKGWVKVHSDTDPRENIVKYSKWMLKGDDSKDWQFIEVLNGRRTGKNIVAQLRGIASREEAATLLGKTIAVTRSALPAIGQNEIYWTDIVGCAVEDVNGNAIGPVVRLFDTGANDVMVVRDKRKNKNAANKTGGEVLIPWIRPSVIVEVNVDEQRIVVDWDPDF